MMGQPDRDPGRQNELVEAVAHFRHAGKNRSPGEMFNLSAAEAVQLLARGLVRPQQEIAMPATPLTTECRAIVARLRAFPNLEGNLNYLRKLIYEDSATLGQLTVELEAIDPAVDEDAVRAMYSATSTVGSVGEGSGNTGLWPRVQLAADAIEGACDLVEGAGEAEGRKRTRARRKGDDA